MLEAGEVSMPCMTPAVVLLLHNRTGHRSMGIFRRVEQGAPLSKAGEYKAQVGTPGLQRIGKTSSQLLKSSEKRTGDKTHKNEGATVKKGLELRFMRLCTI